ncbi:unnamed protein product [Linum trigynum]|uniref:Uncharacterized protein n=1 Tax=Linum trigynum TaxID=586398 RepID=A0AAV2EU80_9ROSI
MEGFIFTGKQQPSNHPTRTSCTPDLTANHPPGQAAHAAYVPPRDEERVLDPKRDPPDKEIGTLIAGEFLRDQTKEAVNRTQADHDMETAKDGAIPS